MTAGDAFAFASLMGLIGFIYWLHKGWPVINVKGN